MSPAVIKRKLTFLIQYLQDLKKFENIGKKAFSKHHYEIERILQLIVEVACDMNAHLLSQRVEKPPSSYFESFILLGRQGIISQKLAEELAPSTGLRNALVHFYEGIEEEKVRKSIVLVLKYFPEYVREIKKNIK